MGSLLCDPPTVVPYGHFVIRNLLFFDDHRGVYRSDWESSSRIDSYNALQYQLQSFFGLGSFFDINFSPRFYGSYKGRYAYCNTGDLTAGLDFQMLEDTRFSFLPGIKFAVREVFPLGNYQLSSNWFLNTTIQMQYQINSSVTVKEFHSYGGGFGTQGKMFVGNAWQSLIDLQLFYKKATSCSLDVLYEHQDASTFYGYPGLNFFGKHCRTHQPSSERVSLAPSFSYQFPTQIGLMAGSWFSVCGRNSERFVQYILNVFYIY